MTVIEIVRQYLKQHGFHGLYDPDIECGCQLDDFMPCSSATKETCMPGHKIKCNEPYCGCNGYHIGP
jgi:hypothetical protein